MIVEYPLDKANRIKLGAAFRPVPRVDLSIDCAIEGQMGQAFVDDLHHPSVFKIRVGPFIYFAGDPTGPAGREMIGNISPEELVMPSAPGWIEAAKAVYGIMLQEFDRYRFSAEKLSIDLLNQLYQASPFQRQIRQMDAAFAARFWDRQHFIDLSQYDSPEDFIRRGIGYYLQVRQRLVGAAYASLACSRGIEVSVYIEDDYRRRGIATGLASHLVLWSLNHNLEPHWDAANPESCRLALKLGYTPAGTYSAYYLSKGSSLQ